MVTGYENTDNGSLGLLQLSISQAKTDDKQIKCFALFHLEDVVNEHGEPAFHSNVVTIKSLRDVQVDLVARYEILN